MHDSSYQKMTSLVAQYLDPTKPLSVLDVGAFDVNGTYKPIFKKNEWEYDGLDIEPGPNVDVVVSDLYNWQLAKTYDLVISGQTLEHVELFWLTWREMVKVTKPGGLLFLIVPSVGPEHRHPVDCWRFYKDGMTALAKAENLELLEANTSLEGAWLDTHGVFRKRP